MTASGTWIDWQYLMDAATLLAKCRYTLQYTYPYAYFMEPGPRKELVSLHLLFLCCFMENLNELETRLIQKIYKNKSIPFWLRYIFILK